MKKVFLALIVMLSLPVLAADYVAVNNDGKIYDQPNAKYVTENQKGDQVSVVPGMTFKTSEHVPGWYKVEYSPGLHAYIPEQIVSGNFTTPYPGNYKVSNNPKQSITIDNENGDWTCTVDGKIYKGFTNGNIVIFTDESNNPAYSLVDFGKGGIVISYDNSVTKFF